MLKQEYKLILYSTGAGVFVWVCNAIIVAFFYHEGSFWDLLILRVPPYVLYLRLVSLVTFIVFGIFLSMAFKKLERNETALQQSQRELNNRVRVDSILLTASDDEMYNEVLKMILEVMESKYGVFGFLDENKALVVPSMTREIRDKCQVPEKSRIFPLDTWGDSTWSRAIREKRIICENAPSTNVPEGHLSISRHISMPIIYREEVIGLFQVANKDKDYSEEDVRMLKTISGQTAPILNAKLQRDRREKERRQAEKQLRESEDKYRILVENIPQKIFFKNCSLAWVSCNENMARDLKMKPEEVAGKSNFDLFPRELAEKYSADDRRVIESGKAEEIEERYVVDGKQQIVQTVKTPVMDEKGETIGVMGIFWDITARKMAEEKLKETLEDLRRSNAELEQFAYVASHDLQEPLRMVASYVQLLERRYKGKLDQDADDFINYAVEGSTRMQKLIQDLLAYSRVGTQGRPFEPVDTGKIVDHVTGFLQPMIQEGCVRVTHEGLPQIMADPLQISQLFQNLISNAIKFRGQDEPQVHVSAGKTDDGWRFSVKDNGIGIDPQYFDRIFIIFQRLHGREDYPGTGIGLSICKKIVERHGGRIQIESEQGRGSTFHFTIPEGATDMSENEFSKPIDILLVEDNPADVRLTREALKDAKVRNNLIVVGDGLEAMSYLKKEGKYSDANRPDLILLDLNLPRKDGREVLAEIKEDKHFKRIPVVILTTSQAEKDILKTYGLHANCYINKPVELDQFIEVVRAIENFWLTIVKLPDGIQDES